MLTSHSTYFRELREDPLKDTKTIFMNSAFDVTITALPIVFAWAFHTHVISFAMIMIAICVLMVVYHEISGMNKVDPIFSDWLLPGGS